MQRDVFYFGNKPNVHPRERYAENLEDARSLSTTEHFWIINEFCDYRNFDWNFDFEFLPDEDVWAENHNNVWPSQHQKDSGTWLCATEQSDIIIYRSDVEPVRRKNIKHEAWVLLDLVDETKFDFSWHPDPTSPSYIYKWGCKFFPAQLKHVLEYHVAGATQEKYMDSIAELLPEPDVWYEFQSIDKDYFDMSWRPDPMDPPFIYVWGNKHVDGKLKPTLEYHTPGATDKKYMPELLKVLPEWDKWVEIQPVDKVRSEKEGFDFSWRPDPREPAYIYTWGNKYIESELRPTLEYHCEGATERKYMDNTVSVLPEWDKWNIIHPVDKSKFDFSWRPDPREPNMIYVFGNKQHVGNVMPTIEYMMEDATERKYINDDEFRPPLLADKSKFEHLENSDGIDYSWRPDPTSPPYIYAWGNQWNKPEDKVSIQYVVEGATEYKYMEARAKRKPCMDNWVVPTDIDDTGFDYSWEPNPNDPPYIYEFATQWQKTGGPKYVVEDATEIKYVDIIKVRKLPSMENWTSPSNIDKDSFDFSWHPDATSPAYIYHFPTQWALSGGPVYTVEGAKEVKYVEYQQAKALPDKTNWEYDENLIDVDSFDFSWHPYVEDQPYIYQFGTQHQKTGGPRYITPGVYENSPIKYIDTRILKAKRLHSFNNWNVVGDLKVFAFDYSWHPDETEEPYIYQFGNTQYPAEVMPTMEYRVAGATQVKYVNHIVAKLAPDTTNWIIPDDVDVTEFDFTWKPNPNDPPYIYEFATQWQKTGGPKYVVEDATEIKYVDIIKVRKLPSMENWTSPSNIDKDSFDFSWHPDATSPAYIYHFPTQWALSGGPVYTVEGAKEVKYVEYQQAKALPDKTNWEYDENLIDVDSFDFSWHPYVEDQPYIYQFGTQHQKTGGPRYITPGVYENSPIKYIDTRILKAKRLHSFNNWNVVGDLKVFAFDYSWHPDETEEPYIYQFGNTQYPAEVMPTMEYRVAGATQVKYVNHIVAKLAPDTTNWIIPDDVDVTEFDFTWKPNPKDPAYIYEFGTQWQKTGGPKYITPGVHKNSPIKYIDTCKVKRLPNKDNWEVLHDYDVVDFDYSWHPDTTEEPFIYQFGNKYYSAEVMPTIEYRIKGATQVKYVHDVVATLAPAMDNWEVPNDIDVTSFDFGWKPSPLEPPYIYEFATQWQKTGGPIYKVANSTERKYIDVIKAKKLPSMVGWEIPNADINNFDFSWHPDATSPPYIYQFGTQWALTGGPKFIVNGATEVKYIEGIIAKALPNRDNWEVPSDIAENEFDFSWHPYAEDEPFIYQFGTQHQKTGGPRYVVPGATKVKYIDTRVLKSRRLPSRDNWEVPAGLDVSKFDFSWHPDDNAPPYIYQFGTIEDDTDGPRYIVPENTGEVVYLERVEIEEAKFVDYPKYVIETTLDDLVNKHPNEIFWAINSELDYTNFDFNWRPSIEQVKYVHAFGSSESESTQTYFVNANMWNQGFRDLNWVQDTKLDDKSLAKLFKKPDMFYVDRGNAESQARFDMLKQRFPKIQKTRYLNSWVDTITRCTNRSTSNLMWVLNSELDYTGFDFDYYPNPWQMKMVHVFGTQWSHWGTTFMVNRESFPDDTKYIKVIEHLSNLNFVKDNRAKATKCVYDIVLIDHGNSETTSVLELLKKKAGDKVVSTVKYNVSYLNTLRDIIKRQSEKKEHYLWICSSVCEYRDFDFSYICDPFAKDQLHVFPSDKQKFGDTFFIDVNKTRELIDNLKVLEDYQKVNYNATMRVQRLPEPVIVTTDDTLVDIATNIGAWPYATIVTDDNKDIDSVDIEPMNLWAPETKNILVTSTGSSRLIVPREVKDYVKKELYDYPYIKKSTKLAKSNPLDIVFLSNGETGADENYEHLLNVTKGIKNRIVRVDGVNGRAQAYHAAALASKTPWMFTVFAKLKVSNKFDWNWQPDRMQVAKHYIFQAKNPVNGLVYGHQAMIAYNKKLTLANTGKGLDFTLDDEHEVVELLSGTAVYNTDSFATWRTAFREVLKLRDENSDVAQQRIDKWMNVAEGDFAQYSIKGAVDALEFYDEVNGDFNELKKSYEWAWLRDRFNKL